MSWAHLSLVSDTEIGEIEPQAVLAAAPWGATTWANPRARAKNLVKIWLERDHPEIVGVADRVRDRWAADKVFGYTGAVYADRTTEALDDTAEDVALATIFTTAANDRLYIGARYTFDGVFLDLLDSVNAVASVLTASYWKGGAGWTSLSATDGTAAAGATMAVSGRVTWTQPTAWVRRDLNAVGEEYYWVELKVSVALTAGTVASQVLPIRAPDALKEVTVLAALYFILNGLAAGAADPAPWQTKADTYLSMAKDLYGQVTIPLDVNLSGAIAPIAEEVEAHPQRVRMFRG